MNGREVAVAHRSSDSLRFFYGICSSDSETRAQVLNSIEKIFESWLEGYGSPPGHSGPCQEPPNVFCADPRLLVIEQLPDLLRLSTDCPYADVRERCSNILSDLQSQGIEIPRKNFDSASSFIPSSEAVMIDQNDVETYGLLITAFLQNNRLEHLFQVMAYHPQYLECFLRTQQYLMRGDGPLPFSYRHYIAIMASSQHQCSYLINIHTLEYLLQDGDEQWLRGLDFVPSKLSKLREINEVLSHQPWLISKDHIENLAKGADNWSMSELMQAVILLIHFHSLSSFVFGCGVNPETDHPDGHVYGRGSHLINNRAAASNYDVDPRSNGHAIPGSDSCGAVSQDSRDIQFLMDRMTQLLNEVQAQVTEDELLHRFRKVETENAELMGTSLKQIPGYTEDPRRATFRVQEYSWEDHGYSLSNRLYPEIGTLLDEKLNVVQNLTYHKMGNKTNVDTSSFRRAVWNYIHCLYGIRHDDYDYDLVDQLLERNLKTYIKMIAFHPERVTVDIYCRFMPYLTHSEKVHINLIVLEARLQAQLLYSLRAITRYMT